MTVKRVEVRSGKSKEYRVDAELLIPGRGDPIEDASLIWKDDKIVFAGARKSIPADFQNLRASDSVKVLMPGMWDCHGE
jgi:imidazolonepropionase-like amidohydrolase